MAGVMTMMGRSMKLLAWLVLLGWLMIWIMRPTNTYRNVWLVKLRAELNESTFFRDQGVNMLIYAFPILFISVLGCFYLHLKSKTNQYPGRDAEGRAKAKLSDRIAFSGKPAAWKGPLGIVSWVQLFFLAMFIALLIWSYATYLKTYFGRLKPRDDEEEHPSMALQKLETASVRMAVVGTLSCAFLFFPVTRGSSILPLFGLSSEASVKYHIWLGHISMLLFTAHGVTFIVYWAINDEICQMVKWARTDVSNVAGELALVSGLVLWVMTFNPIRRKNYELFFYSHQLYALFIFFFLFHVGISFFFLVLPGIYLFLLDRYLRFLQSQGKVRLLSARLLPNETVELNFAKTSGLQYCTLSYVFICVPSLSKLQWHPFSISSSSNLEPETLSVIIKKEGSWTQKLHQTLSSSSLQRLEVAVEGPYGDFSTDFLNYDCLLLVSGGSGITPYFAIIRELVFLSATKGVSVPKVHLICAFKTAADLSMLDLLFPLSCDKLDASQLDLTIEVYVTRETHRGENAIEPVQALQFKPLSSDRPITGILGPYSWLLLGAVISSSFVLFLLLLGIVGRYYIYQTEKNTGSDFSTSTEAVLALIFMLFSIAGVGGASFFATRRKLSATASKIENLDVPFGDTQLESHPHELLRRATTVHYGERPDLQNILLRFEKLDCGVLASGPSGLRGDVARVCSSGQANNLHFQSISFTW